MNKIFFIGDDANINEIVNIFRMLLVLKMPFDFDGDARTFVVYGTENEIESFGKKVIHISKNVTSTINL